MLNPEISSLSPSLKSKGVRFISLIREMYMIMINVKLKNVLILQLLMFGEENITKKQIIIVLRRSSYEMVCELARIAPIILYLENLPQPSSIIEYTVIPKSEKRIKNNIFSSIILYSLSVSIIQRSIIVNNIDLLTKKNKEKHFLGMRRFFIKSLIPSSRGWKSPKNTTLLGEIRC